MVTDGLETGTPIEESYLGKLVPYHPWDWYIYLHLVDFHGKCGYKYTIVPWVLWEYDSPSWGIRGMLGGLVSPVFFLQTSSVSARFLKHQQFVSFQYQCHVRRAYFIIQEIYVYLSSGMHKGLRTVE